MHSPRQTPKHLSFLPYEQQGCAQSLGFFTLIGSLGRLDLLGDAEKQFLAGRPFESAQHMIATLPDGVIVYRAHGAGSLCGVGIAERPESTIGAATCSWLPPSKGNLCQILDSVPNFLTITGE